MSEQTSQRTSERGAGRLVGAASLLAAGNVASRVLGLVRTQVVGAFLGTTPEASAFLAAARVPTMIYDLLIGGMLSAALVPVLSAEAASRRADLWRSVSVLLTLAATVLGLAAAAVFALADPIAGLLTSGLAPEYVAVTARSLRFIAPAVLFFGLAGTVTGTLYALERFTLPAASGAVYNAALVLTAVALYGRLGVYAFPLGVAVGALAQLVLLAPGLRDARLRPRLNLGHPTLRRVLTLYAPIGAGLLFSQLQVAIDTNLASRAGEAAISAMGYATNLFQFPHGFVAVAISVAVLPMLSAAHARAERRTYARTLARGLRAIIVLTVPAAIGLAVLADPVVGALLQRAAFGEVSRHTVTAALHVYLLGLPFASIDWLLNYAFYARQNTIVPAVVGVAVIGVYLAVAVVVGPVLNVLGLPADRVFLGLVLANSAMHAAHALTMLVLLRRVAGPAALSGLGRTVMTVTGAALAMGLAVLALDGWLAARLAAGTVGWGLRAALGAAMGAAVYLPLAAALGVEDIGWLVARVLDRVRAGREPPADGADGA